MLWILFLIMIIIQKDSLQEVKLSFQSSEYLFQRGSVVLVRVDPLEFPDQAREVRPVQLLNGRVEKVTIPGPGRFIAVLENVQTVRLRDNKQFEVARIIIKGFEITEENLKPGSVEVSITARGEFRVIAVDQYGKAVPDLAVLVNNTSTTFKLKTNKEGEVILLGNPDDYHIEIIDGPASIQLKILPL